IDRVIQTLRRNRLSDFETQEPTVHLPALKFVENMIGEGGIAQRLAAQVDCDMSKAWSHRPEAADMSQGGGNDPPVDTGHEVIAFGYCQKAGRRHEGVVLVAQAQQYFESERGIYGRGADDSLSVQD